MEIKVLTCLPRVTIESNCINLGDSKIRFLPFNEWLELEGQSKSAPYDKLRRRYKNNPPVFWEKHIEIDDQLVLVQAPENTQILHNLIQPEIKELTLALHFFSGIPPTSPLLSVTYFDPRSEANYLSYPELENLISVGGVQRTYGESGKEFATENIDHLIYINDSDAPTLQSIVTFIHDTQSVWSQPHIEAAIESLRLMNLPGIIPFSQVLLWVNANEALFIPDCKTKLQSKFSHRLAIMASNDKEEVNELIGLFKLAYQIRSDLVHGRPVTNKNKKKISSLEEFIDTLSRRGVIALARMINILSNRDDANIQSFYEMLDEASESEDVYLSMQNMFETN